MPSTCLQHREAPAPGPCPTRAAAPNTQAPCPMCPATSAHSPSVMGARRGLTSQGPSSRDFPGSPTSSLAPREAASRPAFPLRPCPSCRLSSQGPAPWESPALIPSRRQPPGCPSVAPALAWSPDSMGPPEGQWRGWAGWCQKARGQGRPHRTALSQGRLAHMGTPAPGRAPPTWLGQRHDPWEVAARGPQGAVRTEVGRVGRVTRSDWRLVPLPRGLGKVSLPRGLGRPDARPPPAGEGAP